MHTYSTTTPTVLTQQRFVRQLCAYCDEPSTVYAADEVTPLCSAHGWASYSEGADDEQ